MVSLRTPETSKRYRADMADEESPDNIDTFVGVRDHIEDYNGVVD